MSQEINALYQMPPAFRRQSTQRRKHLRFPVAMPARVQLGARSFPATTLDLSHSGCLLKTDATAAVGDSCQVELTTRRGLVFAKGEVSHAADGRLGIRITPISPLDKETLADALTA